MKFAVCTKSGRALGLCLVTEEGVKPLSQILGIQVDGLYELVENWEDMWPELERKGSELMPIPLSEVKFETPVKTPKRNIICVGKNYLEHARELQGKTATLAGIPTEPIFFSKMAFETIGPEDHIIYETSVTNEVDYEAELAVIIGKRIKNITEADAEAAIFGYTVSNDVSARNLQVQHIQWHKGKSLDTFTPLGPVVVTKDQFDYPPKLKVECLVNGEVRQSSYTDNLIFSISKLIATLSQGMTLIPGDIILTGTPSGVGMGFDPPKYLKDGDIVTCRIEGIGDLTNKVVTKN
ncbi:fumarylacetoacetate hydrolase family protein [Fusibacter paucivorans]|uniref:Fumarylacetoacetate hydrolase family protein n=1 Tax=Fusibacter paucivorans TaxID=76009 RepID=A0ABS5PS87_9FIRM|nr:fumarylacetoacetate hydrolase family protein [Fusibacter paucivorans]MBS7527269.1 fumarylacetoacetate hydrolase family protein [Fusibacter paucivorans]